MNSPTTSIVEIIISAPSLLHHPVSEQTYICSIDYQEVILYTSALTVIQYSCFYFPRLQGLFPQIKETIPSDYRDYSNRLQGLFPQIIGTIPTDYRDYSNRLQGIFPQIIGTIPTDYRDYSHRLQRLFPQIIGTIPSDYRDFSHRLQRLFPLSQYRRYFLFRTIRVEYSFVTSLMMLRKA